MSAEAPHAPRIGLLVTCLVDLFRPVVGFATEKLLTAAGATVFVPPQTCCGQPAYNSGDLASCRPVAEQTMAAFRDFDYVVAPSASCAGMLRFGYPRLFADDPVRRAEADRLAAKTYELTSFLTDVLKVDPVRASCERTATYHDACSALRDLAVREQPRKLLGSVAGLRMKELDDAEVCCGFGGTFCVKYSEVSTDIVSKKAAAVRATGAQLLLSGELGCLLNLAGRLKREGANVECRHVAEVLADLWRDEPGVGDPRGGG